MTKEINEIGVIALLMLFGTGGNILFRINNHLKIKPFYARILMGFMSMVIYILFFTIFLKRNPIFKFNYLIACFMIGYFVEIFLDKMEDVLPNTIDIFAKKVTGGKDHEQNDK